MPSANDELHGFRHTNTVGDQVHFKVRDGILSRLELRGPILSMTSQLIQMIDDVKGLIYVNYSQIMNSWLPEPTPASDVYFLDMVLHGMVHQHTGWRVAYALGMFKENLDGKVIALEPEFVTIASHYSFFGIQRPRIEKLWKPRILSAGSYADVSISQYGKPDVVVADSPESLPKAWAETPYAPIVYLPDDHTLPMEEVKPLVDIKPPIEIPVLMDLEPTTNFKGVPTGGYHWVKN